MGRLVLSIVLLLLSWQPAAQAEPAAGGSPWCGGPGERAPDRVLFVLNLPPEAEGLGEAVDAVLVAAGLLADFDCAVVEALEDPEAPGRLATRPCGPAGRVGFTPFDMGVAASVLLKARRPGDGAVTVVVLSAVEVTGGLREGALDAVDRLVWIQLRGVGPSVPGVPVFTDEGPAERLASLLSSIETFEASLDLDQGETKITPLEGLVRRFRIMVTGPFATTLYLSYAPAVDDLPEEVTASDVCANFPPMVQVTQRSANTCRASAGRIVLVPSYEPEDRIWGGTCELDWSMAFAERFTFPRPQGASQLRIDGIVSMDGADQDEEPMAFVVTARDNLPEPADDEDPGEVPLFALEEEGGPLVFDLPAGALAAFERGGAALRVTDPNVGEEDAGFFEQFGGRVPTYKEGAMSVDLTPKALPVASAAAFARVEAFQGWLTSRKVRLACSIEGPNPLLYVIVVVLGVGLIALLIVFFRPPKLRGLIISAGEQQVVVFAKASEARQTSIAVGRLLPGAEGMLLLRRESGNRLSLAPTRGAVLRRASGEDVQEKVVVAVVLGGGRRLRLLQQLRLADGTLLRLRIGGTRGGTE